VWPGWGRSVYGSPEETLARIEEDTRRAQERGEKLPVLQAAIADVRAKAEARTRDISVEVDAAGVVRDLEIADSALDRGGRRVSAEVMELIAKATKNARVRTLDVTTEIMGESDPIVGVVAAELIPDQEDDGVTRRGGLR